MGYRTRYALSVDGDEQQCIDCAKRIGEVSLGETLEGSPDETFDTISNSEMTWYEWEKDLKLVSTEFPDVQIGVFGTGEENADIWQAWFKGGEHLGTWTAKCDPPTLEEFLAAKGMQPRESGLVKTNVELARMIEEYCNDADLGIMPLADAARDVLAGVDEPDGVAAIVDRALCDSKDVRIGVLQDQLGNMGIALGLVEAQRDDLLVALEAAAKWMEGTAEHLGDAELDRGIRRTSARRYVRQFGQGAGYRAEEARAAIAKAKGADNDSL